MLSAAAQQTKNSISLRGSAQLVSEFFFYGINSILYQRGLYPPEMFERAQQYGIVLLVSNDAKVLERWQFDIKCDRTVGEGEAKVVNKSEKDVRNEMRDVIRQITATVTFLPMLGEDCSFDILVYTDKNANMPEKWSDSDPLFVSNPQEVKLRSFSTLLHNVDAAVCYKTD